MKTRHNIIRKLVMGFGCWVLMAACSSDTVTDNEEPLPEGMGRIRITICTPENNPELTRAVNTTTPWIDPDHEWERLQTFRILICKKSNNEVVQIISGTKAQMSFVPEPSDPLDPKYPYKRSAEIKSAPLDAGDYYIYATANYADGYDVGSIVNPDATVRFPNGYSTTDATFFGGDDATNTITKPIPMTGKLTTTVGGSTMKTVTVNSSEDTDAGTITVWRVMGKLQFYFTNESKEEIQIMGIEMDPINQASSSGPGIYLFSHDDLTSTANLDWGNGTTNPGSGKEYLTLPPKGSFAKDAREDVGPVTYEISTTTPLLTLEEKNDGDTDEGTLFFYVNESDATFTMTENQYSLRFKIKRGGTISELRYGVTTHYGDGSTGKDGFNVIRRNDWIHIPIILTDWHYRIEPLPFVPIGGYPAVLAGSDGLTATFSTGGMIALQPFIKKTDDATWRDFGDPEVSYGGASWEASIHWKNADGEDKAVFNSDGSARDGAGKIVKTAFAYDPGSKYIIGELNNDASVLGHGYMTTFTVHLKLGSSPQYEYTFTFNIVLE